VFAYLLDDGFASRLGFQPYDQDRFGAQAKALLAALSDPLGKGPGSAEYLLEYATHNSYVRLAYETGWIGLWLWLAFIGFTMTKALRCALRQGSSLHEILIRKSCRRSCRELRHRYGPLAASVAYAWFSMVMLCGSFI